MKQELVDQLYKAAPKLYHTEPPLSDLGTRSPRAIAREYGPPYVGVSDGWFQILLNLSVALEALGEDITITQIKEKFGGLRFYVDGCSNTAWKLIEEAEELSETTCEVCGEPGKSRGGGWISVLCDKHEANDEDPI